MRYIRMECEQGYGVHVSPNLYDYNFGRRFTPKGSLHNGIVCRFALREDLFFEYFEIEALCRKDFEWDLYRIRIFNSTPARTWDDGQALFSTEAHSQGMVMKLEDYLSQSGGDNGQQLFEGSLQSFHGSLQSMA